MTQNEVQLQTEKLSPSPEMTKEAILSLLKQDDIKQAYAKQRADDYGKYISNHGDPLKFESWYSKQFPLTDFAKQHAEDASPGVAEARSSKADTSKITTAPPSAVAYLKQHPELTEQFRAKYGYVP